MTLAEHLFGGREGTDVHLPVDLVVTDDWTTPALLASLTQHATTRSVVPVVLIHDHTRPIASYEGEERLHATELRRHRDAFVEQFGATLIEHEGIQHHVLLDHGHVDRGLRVIGNDSHTPTLGAVGAIAVAGQPATVARAMQTGHVTLAVPKTFTVHVTGTLGAAVTIRDVVLTLLAHLRRASGVPEVTVGRLLCFQGPGLAHLDRSERAILANVAPEAVALTSYLDENGDASPDVVLDLATIEPVIAPGASPLTATPLGEGPGRTVDRVFVGTCAGGTQGEIEAFARTLFRALPPSGRVNVEVIVAPATRAIADALTATGTMQRLEAAGVTIHPPGCSACFGFGARRLQAGEVAVSTGNRNAPGRMGSAAADVVLASGPTAGTVAATGRLPNVAGRTVNARTDQVRITWPTTGNVLRLHGTVTTDDLTPSAVPGIGTSSTSDPDVLRRLLLHHLDPSAAHRKLDGMVIVADHAFGMGSNRASSVRALQVAGIRAVVARSVAPLYAMGARDAGLPVHTVGDDEALFSEATPASTIIVADGSIDVVDGSGSRRVGRPTARLGSTGRTTKSMDPPLTPGR